MRVVSLETRGKEKGIWGEENGVIVGKREEEKTMTENFHGFCKGGIFREKDRNESGF